MTLIYGPQPLQNLNIKMRHGFEEQYKDEHLLQALANDFIFYFDDKRHRTNGNPITDETKRNDKDRYYQPITNWKITKDRQKTVSAALLLCLNLGVDPPDVIKTHPCARVEAWVDPLNFQDSKKAIEQIGKNLQSQYETLSLRTRYKQSLDPCVEDVKRFCNSLRRQSKDDQILFHYNGHGVPQPTPSGEIWVFNRGYTQYIPISLYDLQTWLGAPCIFVYDCNSAGNIVKNFEKFVEKRIKDDEEGNHDNASQSPTAAYKDCFQLASCRSNELLIMNPELPADLFTCCLTCPIEISIRIFLIRSPLKDTKYKIFFDNSKKHYDAKNSYKAKIPNINIPGMLSDRRTPLGELNWIFTAITDTIAWTSLPRSLFKKLFRHDLMIAALFRNFLLAKRIMPWYNCHPLSTPELPDSIANHEMWKSWDLAMDEVLSKIVENLKNTPQTPDLETQMILQQEESLQNQKNNSGQLSSQKLQQKDKVPESIQGQSRFNVGNLSTMSLATHPGLQQNNNIGTRKPSSVNVVTQLPPQQFSGFFEQNLTAFELWLKYVSNVRNPPEQLPIVLQVLLSQVHRIRALVLLSRFLDLGPWAVYLSLSIGIFPYVLKLLQSPAPELKPILVFIWARIMSIDYKNTQAELIKEKGFMYFINILVPDFGMNNNIHGNMTNGSGTPVMMSDGKNYSSSRLQQYDPTHKNSMSPSYHSSDTTDEQKAMSVFVLSSFVRDFSIGQKCCFEFELVKKLCVYIQNSEIPLLRQWCVILIGLLYVGNPLYKSICMEMHVFDILLEALHDPVPEVRTATILSLNYFISDNVDTDTVIRLQQEYEQQYQQLQIQLQQLINNYNQKQNQQHMEQQQVKLEQQMNNCINMQRELENVDLKVLRSQEVTNLIAALELINDGSPLVRKEVIIFLSKTVYRYINFFIVVAFNELVENVSQFEKTNPEAVNYNDKQFVGYGSVFSTVWKALLILASDPYLENRELAEEIIDYVLIELSMYKELREPFGKLEQYFVKRNSKVSTGGKYSFRPLPINGGKTQIRSFTTGHNRNNSITEEDGPLDTARSEQNRSDTGSLSINKIFKSLGLDMGDTSKTHSDNASVSSGNENDLINISLLNDEHGMAPIPKVPRYRNRKEKLRLPFQSTFLDYACEYFQEPQMRKPENDEKGSVEYNKRLWRKNRNDFIIQETQNEKKLALYGDWSKKLVTFDNKTQPKTLQFTQFEDHLGVADDRDNITVFDWKANKKLSRFSNGNPFGTKITDLKFINEDDTAIMMTGSSDGIIKLYKNYSSLDSVENVASWKGLTEMLLTPRSYGLITEWQQSRGSLLATGDVKIIRIWDAHTETIEVDIPAKTSALMTSLTSDQFAGDLFVGGFSDGTIRVYDRRLDHRNAIVRRWRTSGGGRDVWINNVHLQRGGYRELISGATNGVVELWDIRSDDPVKTFSDENIGSSNAQRNNLTMTTAEIHEHAPVIATSTKQIKIWTTSGDLLSCFKNSTGSNGVASTIAGATGIRTNRVTSSSFVSAMSFHPHRMMLVAANSHDTRFNIYKCKDNAINY
ncbi:similar to Saccharomyces cerevisiae YHR186C KOG1 Subunit of TORC1, a rapamycin-sensitive complex involved in growth control that contains Tor1p or Tor2p, Lst8p and Tco89p [Maudiozyma saulgeensis]|uniref:Similar to Saccharomyces cerevisiae YHR186C KOG1 Subunit of TORC1, a rapamycin-sensitive complex involved in growth control that contains Tor1p or Tor2p, Lst8p and Tco89p n=1 Tax=Maudiozyma saulgeensis TaxID=1789683 RepID=A0A1X7RAP3_9SACH|nr:similar to Saccharomyces cerevisiae YHR186C KOG1 Subunit of TORC1, a rapamycin-sensitive complex involved in growth control that contains Tor1p or Tor2p, Lst8p and Tco89p [Kazachstania saulgeensis]